VYSQTSDEKAVVFRCRVVEFADNDSVSEEFGEDFSKVNVSCYGYEGI
jgi:hypothetical protein